MAERVIRGGTRQTIYDLSDCLSNATADFEPVPHSIGYMTPAESIAQTEKMWGLPAKHWPGGVALAAEVATIGTHSGTHVDAPWHYGPAASGRALTIDEVPLSWCFGAGVRLDVRALSREAGATRADVEAELARIGHELQPLDVVLVWTGTDLKQPGYENRHVGLRRDATEYLVDAGVRLIGIDAWGLDRPFDLMAAEAKAGDDAQLWESHLLGREKPYLQIERLANLGELPAATGFTVYAFPFKLEGASAGWSRVVAVVDEPA
jgi:kynurenine formamidase